MEASARETLQECLQILERASAVILPAKPDWQSLLQRGRYLRRIKPIEVSNHLEISVFFLLVKRKIGRFAPLRLPNAPPLICMESRLLSSELRKSIKRNAASLRAGSILAGMAMDQTRSARIWEMTDSLTRFGISMKSSLSCSPRHRAGPFSDRVVETNRSRLFRFGTRFCAFRNPVQILLD